MKFSKGIKTGVIIILLIGFFATLNLTGFSKNLKNFFYSTSSPIQKPLLGLGNSVSNFFQGMSKNGNLAKENVELKLKIEELLSENAKLKELKSENDFLRQALNIDLQKDFSLVLANALGKDVSPDFILIDKGEKNGIQKGFVVITQQKAMLGKISEVYENYAKIMLISDKNSKFAAKISETDILGEVKGEGNSRIFLDRISLDDEIKEGDLVITAPSQDKIPGGILFGKIKEVKNNPVEIFQQAEIEPAFNIQDLDRVFVVVNF